MGKEGKPFERPGFFKRILGLGKAPGATSRGGNLSGEGCMGNAPRGGLSGSRPCHVDASNSGRGSGSTPCESSMGGGGYSSGSTPCESSMGGGGCSGGGGSDGGFGCS